MSKIQASTGIAQVKPEEVQRFVDLFCQDVTRVVNGNLDFATNFNAKALSVNFSAANTDVAVAHGLGRVVVGYVQTGASAAMSLYDGSKASTSSTLYLRSSATGTARILVY